MTLRFHGLHQVFIGVFLGLSLGIILLQQTVFLHADLATDCTLVPDETPCSCAPPHDPGYEGICRGGYCDLCPALAFTCAKIGSNRCEPDNCIVGGGWCSEGWESLGVGDQCAGWCCCNRDADTCDVAQ